MPEDSQNAVESYVWTTSKTIQLPQPLLKYNSTYTHASVSQVTNASVPQGLCSAADRALTCSTPNSTSSLPEQTLRCTFPTLRRTSASRNSIQSSRSCCTAHPRRADLSASSNPRTSPSSSGLVLGSTFISILLANAVHSM